MNKELLDMQISKQWSQKTSMIIDDASRCSAFQRKKCTCFSKKEHEHLISLALYYHLSGRN